MVRLYWHIPVCRRSWKRCFRKDNYLLPSSIHEMIIVPKDGNISPKELGEMVRNVNETEVAREEVTVRPDL